MLTSLQQMHLKLPQKKVIKKKNKTEATVDLAGNKITNKITKKNHLRIIQRLIHKWIKNL